MDPGNLSRLARDCGVPITDEAALIRLAREHQREPVQASESDIDPETGLTWRLALVREKVIALRRENDIAENALRRDWMPAERHFTLLKNLCTKLDQAPGRAKSQLGLTEEQRLALQKIIDDLRAEFVENGLNGRD